MELTPRTGPTDVADAGEGPPRRTAKGSRLPAIVLLVVVVGVGGYVLLNALGSATTFYRNVDEAVAQKDTLGTKRFRLQGTVVPGSVERTGDGVDFVATFNGVELPVHHVGDPPELFKENEAVLLEGSFDPSGAQQFDSDLMIVKHSEEYKEEEGDRLKEADEGGHVSTTADGGSS